MLSFFVFLSNCLDKFLGRGEKSFLTPFWKVTIRHTNSVLSIKSLEANNKRAKIVGSTNWKNKSTKVFSNISDNRLCVVAVISNCYNDEGTIIIVGLSCWRSHQSQMLLNVMSVKLKMSTLQKEKKKVGDTSLLVFHCCFCWFDTPSFTLTHPEPSIHLFPIWHWVHQRLVWHHLTTILEWLFALFGLIFSLPFCIFFFCNWKKQNLNWVLLVKILQHVSVIIFNMSRIIISQT